MIHENYDKLTEKERALVDDWFSSKNIQSANQHLGFLLLMDDTVERAVDAMAKWILESRTEANGPNLLGQEYLNSFRRAEVGDDVAVSVCTGSTSQSWYRKTFRVCEL